MKPRHILMIFIICSFFHFCYIIFNDNGYLKVRALEVKKNDLVIQNEQLMDDITDLSRKVERMGSDKEYIEYVIRNEFNMVCDDEIVVYFRKNQ